MQFDLSSESCARIFDNLYDGLYLVDRYRKISYWNKSAERISGFTASEVLGRSCSDNILTHVDEAGNSLCKGNCPLAMSINDGENREADIFLHHKNGHRIPVSVRIGVLKNLTNEIIGGIELFSDISKYKSFELKAKELEELAMLDNLTKIANRNYMEKEFNIRFEERKRIGISFGVLFIDIDHFKNFNDTYGHDIGDSVLKFVAETLAYNSRPFDIVGRWGGEEFVIIVRNANLKLLESIGNRLRMLVEKSYILINNEKTRVTISVGATTVQDEDTVQGLLKRADSLLYESKKEGRNRLTIA